MIRAAKSLIPNPFPITEEMRAWAEAKVPAVDVDREHEVFCDYWLAHGRAMADWAATWRNWMRRAPQMGGALKARVPLSCVSSIVERTRMPGSKGR